MLKFSNYPVLSTKLNGSKYCYGSLTIQSNISHLLHTVKPKRVLFQTIHFSKSTLFKCQNSPISTNYVWRKYVIYMSKQFYFKQFGQVKLRNLNVKTALFHKIQFSIRMQLISIFIDRTQSGAITLGQSELGS